MRENFGFFFKILTFKLMMTYLVVLDLYIVLAVTVLSMQQEGQRVYPSHHPSSQLAAVIKSLLIYSCHYKNEIVFKLDNFVIKLIINHFLYLNSCQHFLSSNFQFLLLSDIFSGIELLHKFISDLKRVSAEIELSIKRIRYRLHL